MGCLYLEQRIILFFRKSTTQLSSMHLSRFQLLYQAKPKDKSTDVSLKNKMTFLNPRQLFLRSQRLLLAYSFLYKFCHPHCMYFLYCSAISQYYMLFIFRYDCSKKIRFNMWNIFTYFCCDVYHSSFVYCKVSIMVHYDN